MSLNVLTQGGGTGGETASIFVTGLSEADTVTATKDGKTIAAKWNSAESRFEITKIKDYGMWTVTATDGEQTATQDVLVDVAMDYEIEMEFGKRWLYRSGEEYDDVTGGWILNTNSFYAKYGTNNSTKENDHLSVALAKDKIAGSYASYIGGFATSGLISRGERTKMYVEYSVSHYNANGNNDCYVVFGYGNPDIGAEGYGGKIFQASGTSVTGNLTAELDISSATEDAHVYCLGHLIAYNASVTINIYKVWLE